jgi:lipid-binding SYLF domain-containing protein
MMAKDNESAKRLDQAATVFSEIMATPDKGIPRDLLENARCIVIVPNLKTAAFIVGGKYGKGYVSCRKTGGLGWSAPDRWAAPRQPRPIFKCTPKFSPGRDPRECSQALRWRAPR